MKSYISTVLIFAGLLVSIPSIPMLVSKTKGHEESSVYESSSTKSEEESESDSKAPSKTDDDSYLMLDITTGKVEEISQLDYVVGAVCAEMPATFEEEALKAQAVAAHTYAQRQKLRELANPSDDLGGAYFSNDSTKFQAYFTDNQAKQYYGENYDMYIKKIRSAAEAVQNEIIEYDDQPIIAAFHSMSSGKTESAENVWGSKVDYLVPVDSSEDTSAPKYLEEYTFSTEEMQKRIENAFGDLALDDDPSKWFGESVRSDSGTVLTITLGDRDDITGQEIRTALSLRSADFEVTFDNGFKVTTKGYGHCVGMSQYGANAMAQDGKTYSEILEHYYPGTSLVKI